MEDEMLKAKWQQLPASQPGSPIARSSHAIAVVGDNLYVFGGENAPRQPVDNDIHVFDLVKHEWSIASVHGDVPAPRVGATMVAVGSHLYVFGGRDALKAELSDLYSFDTVTRRWTLVTTGDQSPPHRSYHAMAVHPSSPHFFVFGGCGKAGRLNDLWSFDTSAATWTALPTPPPTSGCVPRGGPGLAVADDSVWVLFGFCGHELGDLHRFSLSTHEWQQVDASSFSSPIQPSPRSVLGAVTLSLSLSLPPLHEADDTAGGKTSEREMVLIYGGEVDPSDKGHEGAGKFSSELFLLDVRAPRWHKLRVVREGEGEGKGKRGGEPGARGWFSAAAYGQGMVIYGGHTDTNERLDDMYMVTLE